MTAEQIQWLKENMKVQFGTGRSGGLTVELLIQDEVISEDWVNVAEIADVNDHSDY